MRCKNCDSSDELYDCGQIPALHHGPRVEDYFFIENTIFQCTKCKSLFYGLTKKVKVEHIDTVWRTEL